MAASCYEMAPAISCATPARAASNQLFGASNNVNVLPLKRDLKFRVRSMSSEKDETKEQQVPIPFPPEPAPAPKPKVSTDFFDVLAFSGPAPERINGRLAMIGFVAEMVVEIAKGEDIFSQIEDGGFPLFLGTSILLSVASLIPMFKGVTTESLSGNVMTSDAELWNGRIAMLGLFALALAEFVKGGPLV